MESQKNFHIYFMDRHLLRFHGNYFTISGRILHLYVLCVGEDSGFLIYRSKKSMARNFISIMFSFTSIYIDINIILLQICSQMCYLSFYTILVSGRFQYLCAHNCKNFLYQVLLQENPY